MPNKLPRSATPEQPLTDITPLEWIKALYSGAVEGFIEYRLIKSGKIQKHWTPFNGQDSKTLEDVSNWVAQGYNVYYGVSLRKEKVSGDAGCLPTHLIWADLDLKDSEYMPEGQDVKQMTPEALHALKLAMFADLMRLCTELSLLPAAVVNSGHGLQVIWKRDGRSDTKDTEDLNLMLCGLFDKLGADKKTRNAERILRLPSSQNLKNPDRPLPVDIWLLEASQTVSSATLEALMPKPVTRPAVVAVMPKSKPSAAPTGNAAKDRAEKRRRAEVQAALLSEAAKVAAAPEGQRNDVLNVAAVKLARFLPLGELEEHELMEALTGAALSAGLDTNEVMATIRSGITHGTKDPADLERFEDEEQAKEDAKRKAKPSSGLRAAAGRIQISSGNLPSAQHIPKPQGQGGTYSDEQLRGLLGLTWPVVGLDTDKAHSYRLKDAAGDDLGYVAEFGGYVAWNGKQWLSGGKDGAGQVEAKRRVQALGVFMQPEVSKLLGLYSVLDLAAKELATQMGTDSREFKEVQAKAQAMEKAYFYHSRAAKQTESDNKQKSVLSSAKTLYVKDIKLFETRSWVVGFQNGTWDKGTFRAAQRDDHMLTLAAVDYEPEADLADWLEVLERITGGDADLAQTLQDVAGYALSGASSLRCLVWLYGVGGTGKSTFDALLSTVLGELATTVDPKMLAADAARERLGAAIWGKRVATISEAGNSRLDAEALKMLSGGDRLSVRMLYAEAFTARASHLLMMVANDAPKVEAYDDALKERVLALPFDHRLDAGAALLGGKRLEELRQNPHSALVRGFASWAVIGLARVYSNGKIHKAAVCQAATRGFWADVDPLHDFWLEQDRSELVMGVSVSEFRKRYEDWCNQSGRGKPLGAQKFKKACRSVGLDDHSNGVQKQLKLFLPALYPTEQPSLTDRFDRFDPISPKPINSLSRKEEVKGFRENGLETVKPVRIFAPVEIGPAEDEL